MNYSDFDIPTLFQAVSNGDPYALEELIKRFDPLIASESKIRGHVNEDLMQDVREAFVKAIQKNHNSQKFHE